jgi:hypothetical protein
VIYARADRLRSALEAAPQLGILSDEDVTYSEVFTEAAYSGTPRPE